MNGKKARALRKFARAKAIEYLHNKDTYEAARQNFDGLVEKLYKTVKENYKQLPRDMKRKK